MDRCQIWNQNILLVNKYKLITMKNKRRLIIRYSLIQLHHRKKSLSELLQTGIYLARIRQVAANLSHKTWAKWVHGSPKTSNTSSNPTSQNMTICRKSPKIIPWTRKPIFPKLVELPNKDSKSISDRTPHQERLSPLWSLPKSITWIKISKFSPKHYRNQTNQ